MGPNITENLPNHHTQKPSLSLAKKQYLYLSVVIIAYV